MKYNNTHSFVPKGYTIATEAIGTKWPFEDFVRLHGEYGSVVAADSKRGIMEFGIFEDANNYQIVACVSNVVKKYNSEEFEKNKPNLEVVVLESRKYCVCSKWEDVDLDNRSINTWSLLEFAKANGKMQVGEFLNKESGIKFKACVFTKSDDGTRVFVAFSSALGELTPKEITSMKDDLVVVQYENGNYSLCKKGTNSWEEVYLDEDEFNQDNSNQQPQSPVTNEVKEIFQSTEKQINSINPIGNTEETSKLSSSGEKDINWHNLKDIKRKALDPITQIRPLTDYPYKAANGHLKTNSDNASSRYLAVIIDVIVVLCVGIIVFLNEMIRLEQDRELFLGVCCLLAVVAWGYPYFDNSVKIDNDGCFEQGCIHPIIGVFGILFFPLFLHYWLYKGIKWCIVHLKNHIKYKKKRHNKY